MPYLKITTNKRVEVNPRQELLKVTSKLVASEPGRPEQIPVYESTPSSFSCSFCWNA